MGSPYEKLRSGNEIAPAEAGADSAEEAQTEIRPDETAEPQAETDAEAGAAEFGPETISQAEAAMRREMEGGDVTPEDRERGGMVADEAGEFRGVLSRFSGTKTGRAVSRALAGGMIALSLAAFAPPAEAGGRGHARRGEASVSEIVTAGVIVGVLGAIYGGSRASQEAIRTERERMRAQARITEAQIRANERIRIKEIDADTKIRVEEIRKGIGQSQSQPRQEQAPNVPPPPPTPEQQPSPPPPPAETRQQSPESVIDE